MSYNHSFAMEVGPFGPREVKKALADSEMVISLLREYPKEKSSVGAQNAVKPECG